MAMFNSTRRPTTFCQQEEAILQQLEVVAWGQRKRSACILETKGFRNALALSRPNELTDEWRPKANDPWLHVLR